MTGGRLGRVEEHAQGLRWRVVFPDTEHAVASSFLRELAASDCSPATLRSYAFALLRWFRFLHDRLVSWERAERVDVRAFVEFLRETPNPQRPRRRPDAPAPGSVNPRTGKPVPGRHYAGRTINHQLTVLFGFYEHACGWDTGPLMNPVPAQRGRDGGRLFAHHNPMEDFVLHRRATYRQKAPQPVWRAIPDDAADKLFAELRCNRDRALVSFWLTSGARASELLGLRHGDLDVGGRTITVVSKGSRLREAIPASVDSFVWLALYLAEAPPAAEGGPVWWTRQRSPRPLNYHAARAVLVRDPADAGSRTAARPPQRPGGIAAWLGRNATGRHCPSPGPAPRGACARPCGRSRGRGPDTTVPGRATAGAAPGLDGSARSTREHLRIVDPAAAGGARALMDTMQIDGPGITAEVSLDAATTAGSSGAVPGPVRAVRSTVRSLVRSPPVHIPVRGPRSAVHSVRSARSAVRLVHTFRSAVRGPPDPPGPLSVRSGLIYGPSPPVRPVRSAVRPVRCLTGPRSARSAV